MDQEEEEYLHDSMQGDQQKEEHEENLEPDLPKKAVDPRIDNNDPTRMTLDEALIASGIGWVHILVFFICGTGWLFDGAGLTVISFTIPKMTAEWGLTPIFAGSLGSSIYVGMFFGSLLGGMISDSFGRKIVFLGGFFINSLFGMFSAVAPGYYSFFALRAISGLGLGAAIPVSLGWALEFSAIKKRGALSAFMNIFWAFGAIACCLMAWIIIPTIGWRWLVFIVNFIGIFVVLGGVFVPESPRFLYTRGKTQEALNIINMFRAWNFQPLITVPLIPHDEAFQMIKAKQHQLQPDAEENQENEENEENYVPMGQQNEGDDNRSSKKLPAAPVAPKEHELGFLEQFFILFSDKYATSTLLLWCMWWLLSYGSGGFQFLIPQVFDKIQARDPYPNTLAVVGVSFIGYLASIFLMDFFPRKMILFLAYTTMGIISLFLGIWSNVWYMMAVAMVLAALNGIPWSTIYVYTPEVYPTACRTTGMGICSSFNRLASCIAPIIGQQLLATSYFLPFLTFGGALLLGAICTLFLPTETLNTTLKDGIGEDDENESKSKNVDYEIKKLRKNRPQGDQFSERIL